MITPEDIRPSTPPDVPAVIVPPARDVADGEAFAAWLDTAAARARAAASAQVLPLPRVERAPEARPRMIDEDDDEDSLAPWQRTARGIHGEPLAQGYGVETTVS